MYFNHVITTFPDIINNMLPEELRGDHEAAIHSHVPTNIKDPTIGLRKLFSSSLDDGQLKVVYEFNAIKITQNYFLNQPTFEQCIEKTGKG